MKAGFNQDAIYWEETGLLGEMQQDTNVNKEIERRQIFRVYFIEPIEAVGRIISISNCKVNLDKYMKMKIIDLSAGGAQIASYLDMPGNGQVIINLNFQLGEEVFEFKSKIVWSSKKNLEKLYGLEFVNLSERQVRTLIRQLNLYQTKNRKYKKIITQNKVLKYNRLKPLIKVMDVLPFPAYLIDEKRQVIAANLKANNREDYLDTTKETKCFNKIFGRETPCQYCKLSECKNASHPIIENIEVQQDILNIAWLQVEKQVFLHYFQEP